MFNAQIEASVVNTSSWVSKKLGRTPVDQIRLGAQEQNRTTWAISLPIVQLLRGKKVIVEGQLPTQGASLVVSNHISSMDGPEVYLTTAEIAHRPPRTWIRRSMVDPDYKGSEKEQARRTEKEFPYLFRKPATEGTRSVCIC